MIRSIEKGNFKPMTEINKYKHLYHFEHQNTEPPAVYCYTPVSISISLHTTTTETILSLFSSWHSVNLSGKVCENIS